MVSWVQSFVGHDEKGPSISRSEAYTTLRTYLMPPKGALTND